MTDKWCFWIDRGGTFTDIVGRKPSGEFVVAKLLSENPEAYEDASVAGVLQLLGADGEAEVSGEVVDHIRMGTTVATNALLERKGAKTLFVVNKGFADLIEIGRQARPRLFDLDIRKPRPLYARVEEVDARISLDGDVLSDIDADYVGSMFDRARAEGCEACAIALMHSWKHPEQERVLGELARRAGFSTIVLSHEVDPLAGFVPRAATSVADAYLTPVLHRYVDHVESRLGGVKLHFMQSNGGLVKAAGFRGKDAVLSGPAGGVVGAARTAEALGFQKVIGFDMGGTSTDISVYEGDYERVLEAQIAGAPLRAPMLDVHTVAAGGGSILAFDQGRLRAGPESAGAVPGPAAYRRGGPLTVTDANVMLGRIQVDHFPRVFGPKSDQALDFDAVRRKFEDLAAEIEGRGGPAMSLHELAEGGLQVAVASMARAIRKVTLEKGRDPEDFALQTFGGAGGQHACRVADELGIKTIIVHPFAGVLSALGIGLADEIDIKRASIEQELTPEALAHALRVVDQLHSMRRVDGATDEAATQKCRAKLRYVGSDAVLETPLAGIDEMRASYEALHLRRFGFKTPERALFIDSVISEVRRAGAELKPAASTADAQDGASSFIQVFMWCDGEMRAVPLYKRDRLRTGVELSGPAVLAEATGTTVIDSGWRARVETHGELVLNREDVRPRETIEQTDAADPVLLELFNNMFMSVAERMGAVLSATATSVNIKERLDFSCGVFNAQGDLLANAPHMPVHLGAMGESVRTVLRARGNDLKPGDMIALNDPFHGGSHLPDVTVVAPLFDEAGSNIRFFVANRGHHADIGGLTPGSTPPHSTTLEEEGVLIDNFLILRDGEFHEQAFRELLSSARYPARNPDANVSDMLAQIAANQAGVEDMRAMIERYGWEVSSAYADHILDNAEESVRRVVDRLNDGAMRVELDDGSALCVSIKVNRESRSAMIDFTGTGPQRADNFNAPAVVTRSAVLYVFRCLVSDELPLNEGCMRPLELVIPEGSFLSPAPGCAVVAGNTEVSQAVCNLLLGALGASAASQGTMNNLLFGDARYQYYETICGGAGAGPGFVGASAVHTHMTNTRITDPEIMELHYPLRVEQFAIRRGSGGAGENRGGDGVVRTIRALSDATATLVSSSRRSGPFGLAGGDAGKPGAQSVDRRRGEREDLSGVATVELQAGDCVTIETPGGGGWGAPS